MEGLFVHHGHREVIFGCVQKNMHGTHPDAAWSPRPREPPLTTATLPLRLKMLAKSWSRTSCSADAMVMITCGLEL